MLDLSDKPDLAWFGGLIADVRAAAPDARFLLAGATARDLIMKFGYDIDTGRATEDVDLAFAAASWDEFRITRQVLIDSGRFSAVERGLQHLRHHGVGNSRVDIIPFAGVEDRRRHIAWPPDGSAVMNVVGFREAFDAAITVILREGQQVQVTSLAALILLKFSAWKERRLTQRGKDAHDIRLLLHHYLDAGNQARLHSEAAHLLDKDDFDYGAAGAWLLGFDAQEVLSQDEAPGTARDFFLSLIRIEAEAGTESTLLGDMRAWNPAAELKLLQSFFSGFCFVK